jgi:preprotein translocase subunit SecD
MNRYPLWVYVTVAVAVVLGLLYTLPNFFGESPTVRSPAPGDAQVDTRRWRRSRTALKKAGVVLPAPRSTRSA